MRGKNHVSLIGYLGQDPETRYTQIGSPVTNFSVATSESWKDKQSGEQKEQTEWHRCVTWNRLAEIAGEYLRKGSLVAIEGKLQTRKWEKDGQTHYTTEIVVRELLMLGGKGGDGGSNRGPGRPAEQDYQSAPAPEEDDIPW